MKLLLLNDTYFGNSISDKVDEILRVGPGNDNDLVVEPESVDIFEAIQETNFKPDAILQVDSLNRRVFFKGIEKFTQPMAFYAVDAPINDFWQRSYAYQFDRVWVDQHALWRNWATAGIDWARWLPLAADTNIYHPPAEEDERDIQILFVGSLDPQLRPKRSAIIHRLRQIADVHVVDGGGTRSVPPSEVADLYRRSKIVLNELLFDGINLRTFEAMACGAVLLTENGRGEEMLFTDGYSLVTFNQSNLENVVQNLLDHPSRTQHVGRAGSSLVLEKHTLARRANQVVRDLEKLHVRPNRFTSESRMNAMWGVMQASMKWKDLEPLGAESILDMLEAGKALDPFRREILEDLTGQASEENKGNTLPGVSPSQIRLFRAATAFGKGEKQEAASLLEIDDTTDSALHLAFGEQLYGIGQDMTPGFNRSNLPYSFWTAFEHYLRAVQLDPTNKEAISRLDNILTERDAVEFTLPLWQRYHLHNPKDHDAEKTLIDRARLGYVISVAKVARKEGAALPLRSTSRRMGARISPGGSGAGRS